MGWPPSVMDRVVVKYMMECTVEVASSLTLTIRKHALFTLTLACTNRPQFTRTNFSIGHRGVALQFPEHTNESYEVAAHMGACIVEWDVAFTRDKELVCRHAQNDLHPKTTSIFSSKTIPLPP